MQQSSFIQRAVIIFGIVMALMMTISLIAPAVTRNTSTQQDEPTSVPTPPPPTLPPPMTDFSGITFDEDYLHPSGLYWVSVPTGWSSAQPLNNGTQAQITLNNPNVLSVIQIYIEQPQPPLASTDDLEARFARGMLDSSWSQFRGGSTELTRSVVDGRLVIEFLLKDASGIQYQAKHIAWFDEDWLYVVRIVVPSNAGALLTFLENTMPDQIHPNKQFAGTPVIWQGEYDIADKHIFRHPPAWVFTDGGVGLPSSYESTAPDGVKLLVESQDGTIPDEAAARDWVTSRHSAAEVMGVTTTTRIGGEGFFVTYGYQNPDGESLSGAAVLLNGEDGKLHTADLNLPVAGVDLNNPEDRAAYEEVAQALDTFSLLTGLRLPTPPTPTPEPTATIEPTTEVELTPEATPQVEATPETTPEATAEASSGS